MVVEVAVRGAGRGSSARTARCRRLLLLLLTQLRLKFAAATGGSDHRPSSRTRHGSAGVCVGAGSSWCCCGPPCCALSFSCCCCCCCAAAAAAAAVAAAAGTCTARAVLLSSSCRSRCAAARPERCRISAPSSAALAGTSLPRASIRQASSCLREEADAAATA